MVLCSACGEQNPERARFCLNCGSLLAEAAPVPPPQAPDEERKLDTLVFVDLVGSTALAEQLDPEDVLGLLELYYSRLRAELERFGGTVEKYIGDAIVTHFGVPVAREDDPERAVRAALAILETVAALNAEDRIRQIQVRIGIATGEVIVTHGVKAEEGKGIAWGDVLNTAARIESAAPVDGILVGEETHRATSRAIEYGDHEPIEAKGKSDPVRVWQVLGLKQEAPVRGRERDAPLVGRSAELDRLLGLCDQVSGDGRPGFATVIGDPGIGKSRLLTELAHGAGETAGVFWGRCLSYGEGITYWPLVEMLQAAAGILMTDEPVVVSEKLASLLESLAPDDPDELRTMSAALGTVMGSSAGTDRTAGAISQAELHWGIRRVFEQVAVRRPLLLVFEDLHWAEPTLFDLIDYLVEADAPIFVLGSARRELETLRPVLCTDGERRVALKLSALGADESEALLSTLLGERELPAGSGAAALLRNAGGNPLFLEETVRMLAEAGVLDEEGDLSELAVPTSLQAMIGARLDGLPGRDKRVAQHASVVGIVFWSDAVADLDGSGDVDPSLEALEERDLVRTSEETSLSEEREWAFKHGLIKDVAYSRLPKGRRAQLHVRFVDWVKARRGIGDELIEIVAYHLEQACRHAGVGRHDAPPPTERAVDALMQAAEKAERREGIREADRFFARALELLGDEQSEQALEAKLGRGGTLNKLGDVRFADELLSEVAEGALEFRRLDLRARALIGRASIATKQARADEARGYVAEIASIAAEVGDPRLQIRSLFQSSSLHSWIEGDLGTAISEVQHGLEVAEQLGDTGLQVEAHMRLVTMLYNLGRLPEAEEQLLQCSALFHDFENLRYQAQMSFQLGLVKYHLGELDEAERLSLQAREWLQRTGESVYQVQNLRTLAFCAAARSDFELAEERLREAAPLAIAIGGWLVVEIHRCLVDALIGQGRLSDAREHGLQAVQSVPADDAYARAAASLVEASLATADGGRAAAAEAFVEALRLLEEQQLPLDLGEARLAFGRALRRLGDEPGAQLELTRARDDLVPTGARGLIDMVERELAEIEGAGLADPLASP
jgi:class 3 adenylate cyclase/tetratricopeptide (TPR) repeat protein